ncbi:hypothetical protein OFN23_22875, partial [Escherichia coli]|nr:hypothetical protein [Escherichia coli]
SMNTNIYKTPYGVFFGVYLGMFWVLSGFICQVYPILTINQWLFVLFLVFCWGFCGLFLGFVW